MQTRACHWRVASSWTLFAALLVLAACGGASKDRPGGDVGGIPATDLPGGGEAGAGQQPPADPLRGGVLVTFARGTSVGQPDDVWHAWVTDAGAIAALEAAWLGTAPALGHIGCAFAPGAGIGDHNAPWSWHTRADVPITVNPLAGVPVRVPPAGPRLVEQDLPRYTNPGSAWFVYCRLTGFADRR